MKRTVLLIVLVGIASFSLGAIVKIKFPWASVSLNRTVTMTELELLCESAHANFRAEKPFAFANSATNDDGSPVRPIVSVTPTIEQDSVLLTAVLSRGLPKSKTILQLGVKDIKKRWIRATKVRCAVSVLVILKGQKGQKDQVIASMDAKGKIATVMDRPIRR